MEAREGARKDSPQEIANVYYHMGFGFTTKPRLRDSGKSPWYRCPNCRGVKVSAPKLCDPDETCRGIKNPLTYYFKKLRREPEEVFVEEKG